MLNIFVKETDEILKKIEKYLDKNNYRIFYKVWETQKERNTGSSTRIICETTFSEAIKNPKIKYKKDGCFEIWAEGPDRLLLYHKSESAEGLYKPTFNKIKI